MGKTTVTVSFIHRLTKLLTIRCFAKDFIFLFVSIQVFESGQHHTDVIQQQTNYYTDLKTDLPEIAEEHQDEKINEEDDIDLHQALMSRKNTRPRTYPLPTVPSQQPTIDQVYGILQTPEREPALNHHKHNRRRRGRRRRGEEVPGTDEDVTDLPSRWDNFTLRK